MERNGFVTGKGRERPTNFISICNNIADSYPYGTPHGVQKDVIQNSLDARKGRRKPVVVDFQLIDNEKGTFLTITDSNTTGLTGDVKYDIEDYEHDLAPDDHWARFEAFGFTKLDPNAIGARGQGKFIFLHASTDYMMFYDTLRADGVYRVGMTFATSTGCPIYPERDEEPWEGRKGAEVLKESTGLNPLDETGTRIIIVKPKEEVCKDFREGELTRVVQETWFRVIEKNSVSIRIRDGDSFHKIPLPAPSPLPNKDTRDHKVWVLGKDFDENEIRLNNGEKYRVKHFHAVYLNTATVREDIRGIAVVHNQMKICSLPMNMAPPQVRERVTGFIEFERDLDYELRKGKNQDPNHYDLRWRRRLPFAIKEYINAQLVAFGREKLGIGLDPRERKRRRRTNAEDWAMRHLMRYARDLDLFGSKGSRPRPPVDPPPTPPPKDIGVSISNFSYPDAEIAPRVNWGHSFSDLKLLANNRTQESIEVAVNFSVLHGDSVILHLIDREESDLIKNHTLVFGPFDLLVSQDHFSEPGEYRLTASIFDRNTGDRIDRVSRHFWVEKDPPLKQPFVWQGMPHFPEPDEHRQWKIGGSINSSATVFYNMSHPAYRLVEDDDDRQGDYLLEIALYAAMQFVLERPNRDNGSPDFHPLNVDSILDTNHTVVPEEVPTKALQEITRYISEVQWRMYEKE